ncbi:MULTISPECIES: hypothetical protein [Calothrix]|uniref:Uncharacterized protein n=2 Tax=Calothrix TaxID=1186 RepID=A0ABR8ADU9_9CYAN|nr:MULTISPECIES: hypothetical protein [Calothrix]MBD2198089.1 hypothetical protein [Calothrix parietina FACHB-288]MBD2226488.1 hypothetical protein [Calothrix anomala FACHB-343]
MKFSQQSTVNSQQSTVNSQPSTVNHQPSTVNRQPSTVNCILNTKNVQLIQCKYSLTIFCISKYIANILQW